MLAVLNCDTILYRRLLQTEALGYRLELLGEIKERAMRENARTPAGVLVDQVGEQNRVGAGVAGVVRTDDSLLASRRKVLEAFDFGFESNFSGTSEDSEARSAPQACEPSQRDP